MTQPVAAVSPPPRGAMRAATVQGIDLYVHWSWLIVVTFIVWVRSPAYPGDFGYLWVIAECLTLFGIVVLHEFGHALACKSVGGRSDRIMLWPLGGVAFVKPPQRPGATLWTAAAGPLVNVVLVPITVAACALVANLAMTADTDAETLVVAIAWLNAVVLGFNCVPIFPLDGGQMLRSVLWFFVGPHRSLVIATGIGLIGGAGLLAAAFAFGDEWLMIVAIFCMLSSWGGFRLARARVRASALRRRVTHACPSCGEAPPLGPCWPCLGCRQAYDAMENDGACPRCHLARDAVACPFCGDAFPPSAFYAYTVTDADESRESDAN